MAGSEGVRVRLDLNDSDFFGGLFSLDKNEKIQIIKVFEKISKFTWK